MSRQKALIITEKPSVAKDVVAALGGFRPMSGGSYWESDTYLCTFAVGHVFELLAPEDIDPAYKGWRLETLPILPKVFQLRPVAGHEKRIAVIGELLARSDVTTLINACDAAREGELIFREITRYFACPKAVRRLWLQSMTPEAIRKGFTILRDGADLDGLGAAAECRAQSDWLIGMNATRAFSVRLRSGRDSAPFSVGRVQTPTLALLVRRELELLQHVPRAFFRLKARFEAPDHEYEGVWFDPKFKKTDDASELRDDRIFDAAKAKEIAAAVRHKVGRASETREETQRAAPWLFNLTGLQKYMASRYKWSARRTLDAAQRCYEQHKVLTYPRTSSSCLPSDYKPEVDRLVDSLRHDPTYAIHADFLVKNGRRNDARVFDDKGVTDHFAIIPTGKTRALAGDDLRVYDAVVRRFLATFHPPAVFNRVKRVTEVDGHHFRTGPVETLMTAGWMGVYERKAEAKDDDGEVAAPKLPPLKAGQKAASNVPAMVLSTDVGEDETRPPARLSEAQLLGLMEHAGRQVENEELAAALMSAEGLGTAATRADIIQNLKHKQYVDESLRPTGKGIQLITVLDRLKVQRLTSAELTARLELELSEVERGDRARKQFMDEIADYTTEVVEAARTLDAARLYPDTEPLGPCPLCKQFLVYERATVYSCGNHQPFRAAGAGCAFTVPKEISGRYIDRVSAGEIAQAAATRLLDGFVSKAGRLFKGTLRLEGAEVVLTPQFPSQDEPLNESAGTAPSARPYEKRGPDGRRAPEPQRVGAARSTPSPGSQRASVSPSSAESPRAAASRSASSPSRPLAAEPRHPATKTVGKEPVKRKSAAAARNAGSSSKGPRSTAPATVAAARTGATAAPIPHAPADNPWLDDEAAEAAGGPRPAADPVPDTVRSPRAGADGPRSAAAVLTDCPVHKDGCKIVETRGAFCCESRLRELKDGAARPFGFMVPRVLCRRELKPAEVRQLADRGSTAELKGFISKTGRPFAARLILTSEGGFTFEFAKQQSFGSRRIDERRADEDD